MGLPTMGDITRWWIILGMVLALIALRKGGEGERMVREGGSPMASILTMFAFICLWPFVMIKVLFFGKFK